MATIQTNKYASINTYWLNELDTDPDWDTRDRVYAAMNLFQSGKSNGTVSISLFAFENGVSKSLWTYFNGSSTQNKLEIKSSNEAVLTTFGIFQDYQSGEVFNVKAEVILYKENNKDYVQYTIYSLQAGMEVVIKYMEKRLVVNGSVFIK